MVYESIGSGESSTEIVGKGKSSDGAAIINLLNTIVGKFIVSY